MVIGLGRFGGALALELCSLGTNVLAIDSDPKIVQSFAGQLPHVVAADTTDIDALRQLGVPDVHRVVVAIGTDIEASIMTTSLLVDLNIPDIWAKAISRQHGTILQRVGAHQRCSDATGVLDRGADAEHPSAAGDRVRAVHQPGPAQDVAGGVGRPGGDGQEQLLPVLRLQGSVVPGADAPGSRRGEAQGHRQALRTTGDAREGLRRFLRASLDELSTNPLWRRLTTHPDEMRAVARKLDPDRVAGTSDNPATALTAYVVDKQRERELIDTDPAVVIGVLQTVLLVPLYAERLGDPALYPKILDLLIDIVTAGLTPQKE